MPPTSKQSTDRVEGGIELCGHLYVHGQGAGLLCEQPSPLAQLCAFADASLGASSPVQPQASSWHEGPPRVRNGAMTIVTEYD